jgi:hypothetical protein
MGIRGHQRGCAAGAGIRPRSRRGRTSHRGPFAGRGDGAARGGWAQRSACALPAASAAAGAGGGGAHLRAGRRVGAVAGPAGAGTGTLLQRGRRAAVLRAWRRGRTLRGRGDRQPAGNGAQWSRGAAGGRCPGDVRHPRAGGRRYGPGAGPASGRATRGRARRRLRARSGPPGGCASTRGVGLQLRERDPTGPHDTPSGTACKLIRSAETHDVEAGPRLGPPAPAPPAPRAPAREVPRSAVRPVYRPGTSRARRGTRG